jgi:para-nitrobenzyl esterase
VGDAIYDIYRGIFPQASPYELSAAARATGRMRAYCVKTALRRAAIGAAPSYNYWFQWQAGNFSGRSMSHHEIEMPLVFRNSDESPQYTAAQAGARVLSTRMADAWLAFARSGDPNTRALPRWAPVTATAAPALVFDTACRIDPGSDLAAIELFWKFRFPNA